MRCSPWGRNDLDRTEHALKRKVITVVRKNKAQPLSLIRGEQGHPLM